MRCSNPKHSLSRKATLMQPIAPAHGATKNSAESLQQSVLSQTSNLQLAAPERRLSNSCAHSSISTSQLGATTRSASTTDAASGALCPTFESLTLCVRAIFHSPPVHIVLVATSGRSNCIITTRLRLQLPASSCVRAKATNPRNRS